VGRKRVLTKQGRDMIVGLRGELDERGNPRWTYEQIAERAGVSLATAYRAAAGVAGYREGRPLTKAEQAGEARQRQLETHGLDDTGVDYLLEQRQRERELGITGEL